jgi:rhodanese-related sulfurtransferase
VLVLDCRTEQERAIASIAGSLFVPLHAIEQAVEDLKDHVEEHQIEAIVVHCHHGVRSLRATAVLRAAGLVNTWSMAGGIHLWSSDIDRSVPTY